MTEYSVVLTDDAEDQLADIWISAAHHRREVTAAQHSIDLRLARDPFEKARHVSEGLYCTAEPPLVVYFAVDQSKRVVEITDIYLRSR